MISSCFYGGIFNERGYCSAIPEKIFGDIPKIVLSGNSTAVKQVIFSFIKSELRKEKIKYTELFAGEKICGIFCKKFYVSDSDFSSEKNKNSTVFSLEKYQKNYEESKEKTSTILAEKNREILRARRFISACKAVSEDSMRLESAYLDYRKINRFTSNLWQRITLGLKGHVGKEEKRCVTCLTADGNELNMETFDKYCEKMVVLYDRTGTCAQEITDRIRGYALGSGYDIISCPCAVNEEIIEHVIIPELGFGIFTSKYYHRDDFENARKIYAKRFLKPSIENIKNRLDFNVKTYRNLMDEVFVSLEKVNKSDKELDEIIYNDTDIPLLKSELLSVLF